jgi:hypothetical protein
MTRNNGEITQSDLERGWPRHVALPAEKVLGLKNRERTQHCGECIVAPLTYSLRTVGNPLMRDMARLRFHRQSNPIRGTIAIPAAVVAVRPLAFPGQSYLSASHLRP